jgi:predicted DNA-binding protein YlxM (UPF0122 family)
MNIYDITIDRRLIEEALEFLDGEITDEIAEALAINQDNLEDKIQGYIHVISDYEMKLEYIKKEMDRLKKLKDTSENRLERLKNYLLYAVQQFGTVTNPSSEAKTKSLKITNDKLIVSLYEKISKKVHIVDESLLDEKYIRTVETKSPDKEMIKKAIENKEINESVARMQESKHLQIK